MRLAIGYVRVSSIEQESGYGPEVQQGRIEAYCQKAGLPPPVIYRESKSGDSILARHEFQDVLARAEKCSEDGGEAHIVFSSLDRMTRDLIDQEATVMRCYSSGVRLHSADPSEADVLDPRHSKDPMRTAIRQFFGIVHQLDKAIIQRRLDGGLVQKAKRGGYCGGKTPFGYRSVNHELEVDPEGAEVVRKAFSMHRRGLNQSTIAMVLSSQHPTLCTKWTNTQVSRILKREDLYAQGLYVPRGMEVPIVRKDLIILQGEDPTLMLDEALWRSMPESLSLAAACTLLGKTEDSLLSEVESRDIRVIYKKGQKFLMTREVRVLAEASEKSVSKVY
jgi:site-specific DNA recombinase